MSAHQRVYKISVPYNTDGPFLFLVSNVAAGSGMFWGSKTPKADKKPNGGFCSAFAYFVGSSEELMLFSKFLDAQYITSVHHPRVGWPAPAPKSLRQPLLEGAECSFYHLIETGWPQQCSLLLGNCLHNQRTGQNILIGDPMYFR